ncbi:oxidoreductase [Pedobacter yulinensis]|uniref:Oxidoreductase n=1 Tax=Pedobacter yulinensis TaxID=2126353 RepID=A0A2T3HN00_9SPHI|nr:SDR family oxidoreductase [Pedobacter yulinensis]PST83773.1 oxidoreductase [Pedobacter yulinensis]
MKPTVDYALVTGATSGIGYELAKLLARDGHNLILTARNEADLERVKTEFESFGVAVQNFPADLSVKGNAADLCNRIREQGLNVSVLVNDAGQGLYGQFKDTDLERELAMIELNISSLVVLTKFFLREMLQAEGGRILNLASIASKLPGPWQSVYHGTKAFVLSFSEAIREELKGTGVTVTALMPGPTDTAFFEQAEMLDSKMLQDESALSDAADVAKDGYEAMMAGKDKVISGLKNKMQVGMSNFMPDSTVAHAMNEQQKPVERKDDK